MKRAACVVTLGAVFICAATAVLADPPAGPPDVPSSSAGSSETGAAPVVKEPAVNATALATINDANLNDHGVKDGVDPAVLKAEIMLDRLHVSPGVIDGRPGENFDHALATYEKVAGLKTSKGLDQKVWNKLIAETSRPVVKVYVTTEADVAGPYFPDLPKDYAKLAQMPTLGYRNPAQKLGAKFHMGEELLGQLNPGIDLGKADQKILVADVTPEPFRQKIDRIIVDKHKGQVVGYDHKGRIVIAVPATIGSRELPSPSGTYRIKGIAFNPKYYYSPENFVQGKNHQKLTLPAGPNNPVGAVFMALTKPTYGLHGTPDPSEISKTASHGCVRMTNWDATQLAHLVRRGVVVRFKG